MNKNMMVYKENLFTKIKNFFLNIFRKDTSKDEIIENTTNVMNNKSNFRSNITIKQDEEEMKILKLQQDYKAGNILEQDMTDEEHKKLIELYKKQNDDLKEKIEIKKNNLRKRLNDLKVS
jgi:hypothetical protein